jgi:hypothetical protein
MVMLGMLQDDIDDLSLSHHPPQLGHKSLLLGQSGHEANPGIANITILSQTSLQLLLKFDTEVGGMVTEGKIINIILEHTADTEQVDSVEAALVVGYWSITVVRES